MNIPGYTYIQHNINLRAWGTECQFTVEKPDGSHINDIVLIPNSQISEEDLAVLIGDRLALVDIPMSEEEVE